MDCKICCERTKAGLWPLWDLWSFRKVRLMAFSLPDVFIVSTRRCCLCDAWTRVSITHTISWHPCHLFTFLNKFILDFQRQVFGVKLPYLFFIFIFFGFFNRDIYALVLYLGILTTTLDPRSRPAFGKDIHKPPFLAPSLSLIYFSFFFSKIIWIGLIPSFLYLVTSFTLLRCRPGLAAGILRHSPSQFPPPPYTLRYLWDFVSLNRNIYILEVTCRGHVTFGRECWSLSLYIYFCVEFFIFCFVLAFLLLFRTSYLRDCFSDRPKVL